ncbi:MAG: acetylornithine deacetylase, partial [Pseudomonadales bacterium]
MPNTPRLKEMVTDLIATPSVSSTLPQYDLSNLEVVHKLTNWLEPLGFDIVISPISGRPGKANLIANHGRGEGGLVLAGHTDTVPLDEHLWQTDPFKLTEQGDRWYGLGTCDMKSFFALVIEALAPLMGRPFKQPLTILGTADEESSMSGARALTAAQMNHARFAVIGEPTSLAPVTQHKGIMMLSLKIKGSSGHSSNPDLGNSALDATARVLDELCAFREELRKKYRNKAFEVDYPTLNLGCIHGGDNPNRICDHVDLAFDVRVLPGMDNLQIKEEIDARLSPKLADLGLTVNLELLHPSTPPFLSSGDELATELGKLTGANPCSVAFATEAPYLTDLGMQTVVLGPGSIDQAHQPNEFIDLQQIDPTIAIIRALIEKY